MAGDALERTRVVRREDLRVYDALVGVAVVARDAQLRAFWLNDAYCRLSRQPREALLGTTPMDVITPTAAEERMALMRRVIATGQPERFIQFGADRRFQCAVLPLDPASFGHPGVVAMAQDAPTATTIDSGEPLPVLSTPCLDELAALTPRELELLYWVAQGLHSGEIAHRLYRSARTIDKHLEAIHRKLGTPSRSALVRLAVERGVQGFREDEWRRIVEGAERIRRSARRASRRSPTPAPA